MALIDTDDLVTYLGLNSASEDTDRLDQITKGASEWLIDATGRDWAQVPRTDVVRGNGQKELVLKHYPVASITSISESTGGATVTLDVTNPLVVDLVNPEQGILARTDGNVWTEAPYRNFTIVYVGGPADFPAYMVLGALELAAYLYQTTGGRSGASTPDASVSFKDLADRGFRGLPAVRDAIQLAGDVL